MKKVFEKPEAIIISFNEEDIITDSGFGQRYGANGDEWEDPEDI